MSKIFELFGGRKFLAVILATFLTFMSVIWTFNLTESTPIYAPTEKGSDIEYVITGYELEEPIQAYSFITILVPAYFALIVGYGGINMIQKKKSTE